MTVKLITRRTLRTAVNFTKSLGAFALVVSSIAIVLPSRPVSAAVVSGSYCSATVSNAVGVGVTVDGSDCVVQFKNVGTLAWTVPSGISSVQVLVVAGGGAGGQNGGGGGGGGGVKTNAALVVTPSSEISVTVGAGGTTTTSDWNSQGGDGGNSSFGTTVSIGGGGGGTRGVTAGRNGGSGGGAGGYGGTGGTGSIGEGNGGGNGFNGGCDASGGGGGGAGGIGTAGSTDQGGNGGNGSAYSITGTLTYFGGGGAGGVTCDNSSGQTKGGIPGLGGAAADVAALANTGGGGGGGGAVGWGFYGRSGGSGIVVVRFTAPSVAPTNSVIPTISGIQRVGETLTVADGTWVSNPTATFAYQWKRASTSGGSFVNIPSANLNTYVLTDLDAGKFLKAEVTATNSAGSASQTTQETNSITDLPDGVVPTVSSVTSTAAGFQFTITNLSVNNSYIVSTNSGTVSRSTDLVTVSGLSSGGSATVTVIASRSGYKSMSVTRTGTALVAQEASTPVAVSETPVVTVPQGQSSVATIAPSAGPTTTVLNPMRSQAPQLSTPTSIPPVVTTTANASDIEAPAAPALAPGEAGAVIDGKTVAASLSRADNQITATAGDITATVSGLTPDGNRIALNAEGNLVVNEGDKLVVSAAGFAPGADVSVWLYSSPTRLGVIVADVEGKVSGSFELPSGLEVGNHRFVLSGDNPDGVNALVGLGLSYGNVDSGSAVTRVLIAIPIALAVLFGLFLPAVTRRRKKNALA